MAIVTCQQSFIWESLINGIYINEVHLTASTHVAMDRFTSHFLCRIPYNDISQNWTIHLGLVTQYDGQS